MSEEFIRERLFKPFESTKSAGMGIGVFESREYIAELGGKLEVASEPAPGHHLQCHCCRCTSTKRNASISPPDGQRIAVTQTKQKLLIIEDDPGLQKQLRWSFDAYDVVVAGDRESALAQIRRHEPAVVTMDLGLPPDPDGATEGLATLQQILALAPDTARDRPDRQPGPRQRGQGDRAWAPTTSTRSRATSEVLGLVLQRAYFLHALQQENRRMQQIAGRLADWPASSRATPAC